MELTRCHQRWLLLFFFSMRTRPPRSPLFPYTTLFRSGPVWRGERRTLEQCTADAARVSVRHRSHRQIARRSLAMTSDRKSTRLNSSHVSISYAVFCLKKKNTEIEIRHVFKTSDLRPTH